MPVVYNSDTSIPAYTSDLYIIDGTSNNITLTLGAITNDYLIYNFTRVDNSTNTVTIVMPDSLYSGEFTLNLQPRSNICLLSYNSTWVLMSGYSKDR